MEADLDRGAGYDAAPWWAGRRGLLLVAALAAAVCLFQAVRGTGFVLDDLLSLGNSRYAGFWSAAGSPRGDQRPGDIVVFALSFGLLGDHPLAHLVWLAALRAAAAALLLLVLRRLLPGATALLVVVVWVVAPNHVATEVWSTASILDVALICLLVGLLLALRPASVARDVALLVVLLAGGLTYEAILFVGLAGLLAVPWMVKGHLDARAVLAGGAGLLGAAAWSLSHLEPAKRTEIAGFADLRPALDGHFGYGMAPYGAAASLLVMVALAGMVFVLAGRLVDRRAPVELQRALIAGLVVIGLGVLPFLRANYEPAGAGDRANAVSSIGGALVWSVILLTAWRMKREIAVGLAAVLAVLVGARRWQIAGSWADAFSDQRTIAAAASELRPAPGETVVVMPTEAPVCENIAVFYDSAGEEMLIRLVDLALHDGAVVAHATDDEAAFAAAAPTARVDLRRLDLRCRYEPPPPTR